MITTALLHFSQWLGASRLSSAVAEHFWVVPALQTIHILSVAVVLLGVLLINLRVVGLVERGQGVEAVLDRFLRPVGIAILVLAISGLLLIAGEPSRAIFRTIFWIKLSLIVVAGLLTWSHRQSLTVGCVDGAAISSLRKGIAVLALLLWLAVVVAGRWIAYVDAWPGAPA
ncbi:DUF6644 family protein [Sphingobium bisphenolivorans]|uniref:DUF6644 family protein n=1 Tax=Sphingobium bisphenolivorans TaxID=1335760 RepID=UPI00039E0926|nr:DUF6644 family protein [Sphingobium bisphenolivorans]